MKKLNKISRIGIAIASLLFLATYKLPFWMIYLSAPQYPEGLTLYIYLHKLSGDVEIINGLNHYIGMGIIDESMFPEFKILPYITGFIIGSGLVVALIGKRSLLWGWVSFLWIFSILALVDFWKWEYAYGHHLDPNAAIQVPGMTYQPPLIGSKQLLNFNAWSFPHGGGFFYIGAVVLATGILVYEIIKNKGHKKSLFKK